MPTHGRGLAELPRGLCTCTHSSQAPVLSPAAPWAGAEARSGIDMESGYAAAHAITPKRPDNVFWALRDTGAARSTPHSKAAGLLRCGHGRAALISAHTRSMPLPTAAACSSLQQPRKPPRSLRVALASAAAQ